MALIECGSRSVEHQVVETSDLQRSAWAARRPLPTSLSRPTPAQKIWVSHSLATVAAELARSLERPDVTVLLWDGVSSLPSDDRGLVVADAATLRRMAGNSPNMRPALDGRHVQRGGLAPGALKRVIAHIEASLHNRIELGDLARMARLSECHFSRAFGQSLGVPPHRYIILRRIAVASELLAGTDRSLVDIALEVGFSDHSHFSRSYLRITGETPRSYRRRHR